MTERILIETYRQKLEESEDFAERKETIEKIVDFCTTASFVEKSDIQTLAGRTNLFTVFCAELKTFFRKNMEAIPSPDCLPHQPTQMDELNYESDLLHEEATYLKALGLFLDTLKEASLGNLPPPQPTG